ncbi:MAG: polyprenyl synthetase family protein [Candidatus Tumulicola sp.]
MPPASFESLPLGEHRARVLEYLRGNAWPFRSVARSIIEQWHIAERERLMLRPNLVLWACAACGGGPEAMADALPVAAAFDLFDRFMLLHDELVEEVDATTAPVSRDPSPTVARWGLGQSLNAGDALYAMALRALAQDVGDPQRRLRAASLVTRAVLEAIEGRTDDVERIARGRTSRDGLLARVRSVRRRSATLTGAALEAGALIAVAPANVCRGFDRAGRLLAAAASSDEPLLASRLAAKALDSIERCISDRTQVAAFENVARHVATKAA